MNTCVIVVPVYNEVPNELEQLSLKQLDTIINDDTEICLVGPDRMNFSELWRPRKSAFDEGKTNHPLENA